MSCVVSDVAGKVVIVTGAAGGIGGCIAHHFVKAGALVVIADIQKELLFATADTLREGGGTVEAVTVDIADPDSVRDLAAEARRLFGPIDVLVHAAAIDAPRGLAWEADDAHWRKIIDVDLTGAFWCCKAVIPGMIERRKGRIIMISSVSAKIGSPDTSVAYNAAKAGIVGLTIGLAKQLEPHNILVNSVAPGSIGTGEPMNADEIAYEAANFPLPIVGPDPVAHACLYLAGDGGSWSSGSVVNVSGGRLHGW
jgi:NAD(P)-dependent dehydrogenase (short-subunit alcohol dehydrogenase family)